MWLENWLCFVVPVIVKSLLDFVVRVLESGCLVCPCVRLSQLNVLYLEDILQTELYAAKLGMLVHHSDPQWGTAD